MSTDPPGTPPAGDAAPGPAAPPAGARTAPAAGPEEALRAEVARLEEIAARLRDGETDPETLRALSDAALESSQRISAMLPTVLEPGDDAPAAPAGS